MTKFDTIIKSLFTKFLSEETKEKSERIIVYIAIGSFFLHLLLIFLTDIGVIDLSDYSDLLTSPIAAIYTPFSFILVYEVYLLIYYLPKSITTYIGKQYEIITLIIIRRIFKDLSKLELTSDWFQTKNDLQFTYDIIAAIVLFFLIFLFYKLSADRVLTTKSAEKLILEVKQFIKLKKLIATFLVPVLLVLAVYSFGQWIWTNFFSISQLVDSIKSVNNIFFDEFFTVLILVDVLLLLFSFVHTDEFYKVIRNSGFIISTILIRLSFGVEGLVNIGLITAAVLFGVIILAIHNQYEKKLTGKSIEATNS